MWRALDDRVGLAMGLDRLGYRAAASLRQSALGPTLGMKGGGAGGGAAAIVPLEECLFGLGSDAFAVESANNLLATAVEEQLHAKLLAGLAARDGVRLLGAPELALASFSIEGVHNADLAHLLTEQGIAVRAGHHCAMPLMHRLGLQGAIRVSLGLYSDGNDLERFFGALDKALELLR